MWVNNFVFFFEVESLLFGKVTGFDFAFFGTEVLLVVCYDVCWVRILHESIYNALLAC